MKLLALFVLYSLGWALPLAACVALKTRQWRFLKSSLQLFAAGAATALGLAIVTWAFLAYRRDIGIELDTIAKSMALAQVLLIPTIQVIVAKAQAASASIDTPSPRRTQ